MKIRVEVNSKKHPGPGSSANGLRRWPCAAALAEAAAAPLQVLVPFSVPALPASVTAAGGSIGYRYQITFLLLFVHLYLQITYDIF